VSEGCGFDNVDLAARYQLVVQPSEVPAAAGVHGGAEYVPTAIGIVDV